MATAAEVRVVNAAGLVQGITLVTFPAASSILTASSGYDLSSTQYGAMFLPQVVAAIAASLLGPRLAQATSLKRVLLLGLLANILSMLLLLASATVKTDQSVAFPLLLVATAFLGLGFGLTVPTVNTLAAAFHPDAADRAVLVLNALLGLGTALAQRGGIPARFWLFAAFALLYGVCETMNGNWSQQYMTGTLDASTSQASIALAGFWAMVTVGRVLFAVVERWVPNRATYHVLPFVLVATFLIVASLSSGQVGAGIAVFALAGLGCSALLPLTISFGQGQLTTMSAAVAGGIIACYQVGYGLAAFGVGPLLDSGGSLSAIFRVTAVVAALLGLVSFAVARRPAPAPTHISPTPRR